MLDQAKRFIANHWKYIVGLAVVLALLLWGISYNQAQESRLQQAVTLTQEQAANVNALQNELKLSKQNAEMLASAVQQAQAGKVQPIYNFTVEAPTVQQAAVGVADRINAKDPTLPPAALEKSDRTLTAPQEVQQPGGATEWQVGVYKVNNYRNWEWSVGYGRHSGDSYIPVGLQRNFSKDRAIEVEYHAGGNESGWETKYTIMTNKLFFLF
ncbi:hypothetical protein HSX37_16065|uniref:Uncharacterized protein n=1 Tax=Dendrosporobacter quercicolus TaxID=146817 RepID=A0A1G9ZMG8_9FIRM|nr:hypothetical protein [Dendrosporobacter quercicolus]NSL49551.1 hypothetical protein [Dendrosporobacter quercicolus DSM 1736]SDN22370.1 hypothetical protein SAMN04488502_1156 [Dendrosporobacter quercicolus]